MTIMLTLSDDDIRMLDEVRKSVHLAIGLEDDEQGSFHDYNLSPPSLMRGLMRLGAERALEDKGHEYLLPELRVKK